MFTIDKNIPMPERRGGNTGGSESGSRTKYPFKFMEIGDSFDFGEYSPKEMIKACNAMKSFKKVTG